MPDAEIWGNAAADDAIVVSKDRDFLDLAAVRGAPPVVFLVGVGNTSTADLLQRLDDAWPSLLVEFSRGDASVVILERDRIVVLRRA